MGLSLTFTVRRSTLSVRRVLGRQQCWSVACPHRCHHCRCRRGVCEDKAECLDLAPRHSRRARAFAAAGLHADLVT